MEGIADFLRQCPSLKFKSASSELCHQFHSDDGLVTQNEKKRKTSTVETTHVGPFTSYFSLPKYPSPLLP